MARLTATLTTTALLLSMAVGGVAGAQAQTEEPPQGDGDAAALAPVPEAPRHSYFTIELEAGAGLAVGLMPRPAVGFVAGILIQTPYFIAIEIVGSLYPFVPQDTGVGEAHWLGAFGGFLLCTDEARLGAFSLRGCAGGEFGFIHVRGAIDPPAEYGAGQALLRARLSYRISDRITVWTRPTLGINGRTEPYEAVSGGVPFPLYDPEPVMGIFDLGLGWVFE